MSSRDSSDFSYGNMRPQMGATFMTLPITFDYSGGRRDSAKSKKVWIIHPPVWKRVPQVWR